MLLTCETTVGQIAAEHPLATRVLARHKIDFCCGGGLALKDICNKKGLDSQQLIDEIEKELSESEETETNWIKRPLNDIIDHILNVHHRPLDEEIPRLETMLRKVHKVHYDKKPKALSELLNIFTKMKDELLQHMHKEETILFPLIKEGRGHMAECPVNVMHQDHDAAGRDLERIRDLTDNYTLPEGACNTWRALWHGLEALEKDLHLHIHLENNILFPRALNGE